MSSFLLKVSREYLPYPESFLLFILLFPCYFSKLILVKSTNLKIGKILSDEVCEVFPSPPRHPALNNRMVRSKQSLSVLNGITVLLGELLTTLCGFLPLERNLCSF